MTPDVSDFIPGSLEDTDKYIEVSEGYHVTAGGKEKVQIKMCDNNGDPFIAALHNIILAPDLCDRLFLIILVYSTKGFARCNSEKKIKIRLHYHIVHKGNMHFGGK